ncbi:MAG: aminotransferase class V-fold PLP-dependent enzyme [Actinomycetota bacterium]|nr:aminotransferase class V-fold PLP-dependent enzyme [Actinomycetota bacterium]
MIDVDRARALTPGCGHVLHLNNAGTSLPPEPVLDAQSQWMEEEARTGGYELARSRHDDLERVYSSVAALIGATADDIALTESNTVAWTRAFHALAAAPGRFQPGQRIITSSVDYTSNWIAYLQAAERHGVVIDVVPDIDGVPDAAAVVDALDDDVTLVTISHIPTNSGLIVDAATIGAATRAAGIPFLLDGCQSIGQIAVDVAQLGCDLFTATGRKYLRAPRGTGFLYASPSMRSQLEPLSLDLHSAAWIDLDRYEVRADARRFETFESSSMTRMGIGAAAEHAMEWGMDAIEARVIELGNDLRGLLDSIGARVWDPSTRCGGIVTFTLDGIDPMEIRDRLRAQKMNVWVSNPTPLDLAHGARPQVVRASVHYYNTVHELSHFVSALAAL